MKIIATFKCSECGEKWSISKDVRDLDEEEDLYCCGKKATIVKGFRGEGPDDEDDDLQVS